MICTCLIPGERTFGKEARIVAAPTANVARGQSDIDAQSEPDSDCQRVRKKTGKNFSRSQVWSQVASRVVGARSPP